MSLAEDIEPQPEHFGFRTKPTKKKSLYETANQLMRELEAIGALRWHTSITNSIYIKFKDIRLGSIRISDHKGRTQYNYTYELTDISSPEEVDNIIQLIKAKSRTISNFNPTHYIVFDPKQHGCKQLDNFEQYKDHILKR